MTELEVYKQMLGNAFYLTINLNDTFAYACGDAEELDVEDVEELMPLMLQYGPTPVLLALASIQRGKGKLVERPIFAVENFDVCAEEILKLVETGHVLYSVFFEKNHARTAPPVTKKEEQNRNLNMLRYYDGQLERCKKEIAIREGRIP